jgi:hypothetical protein
MLQVRFVLELLEQHPTLPLVVVSDTDTVWLREPWDYFADRSSAEFFISTDCLSHQASVAAVNCKWTARVAIAAFQVCNSQLTSAPGSPPRQVEEEWKEMHGQPRCGHVPGNGE